MNALVDEDVIEALYRASQAGVPIRCSCAASAACGRASRASARHRGARDHRPLPRARAHLPLRERRQGRGLHLERRLDAAQLPPPRRGDDPDRGARGPPEGAAGARRHLPGQREGPPAAGGRKLQAQAAGEGRGAVPLAARAPPRGEAGRRSAAGRQRRHARADPLAGRASCAWPSRTCRSRCSAPRSRAAFARGLAQFNERLLLRVPRHARGGLVGRARPVARLLPGPDPGRGGLLPPRERQPGRRTHRAAARARAARALSAALRRRRARAAARGRGRVAGGARRGRPRAREPPRIESVAGARRERRARARPAAASSSGCAAASRTPATGSRSTARRWPAASR